MIWRMDGAFDWEMPTESPKSTRHRHRTRFQAILAIVFAIGGPYVAYEIRGLCWEALLASIVIFAIALLAAQLPPSVWLAGVLIIGSCGTIGLIGWSGWRFHSLNIFSAYSPRLTFCGRIYQPEGDTRKQLPAPFKILTRDVMGVTPSGSAILGLGCQTTVLFVESPGPTYQPYDLLGGP
jgi:hypothetical protein